MTPLRALLLGASLLGVGAGALGQSPPVALKEPLDEVPGGPPGAPRFAPPPASAIPDTPLGDMIRLGRDIIVDTQTHAKAYVGNGLNCSNCHLDAGRHPNAAPLWAAYVSYPAYRTKNGKVNSYAERLEECFRYSMNGTMPSSDSDIVVGLISYSFWLATGAPTGTQLAGRGFREVPPPPLPPDPQRGETVYPAKCKLCHGANGEGTKVGARYVFPPLWGMESFNLGAGVHRVNTAAAFIKANMPLGQGDTLTDQQAWDVAAFMNSHARPPDPRQLAGGGKAPAR